MTVVDVSGGAAGPSRGPAPALLLHPGRAVGVQLPADREGGTEGQVGLGVLNREGLVTSQVWAVLWLCVELNTGGSAVTL